ncbi:hypothetical protein RB595_005907 [Gaeumannomyces hyphopodioides]
MLRLLRATTPAVVRAAPTISQPAAVRLQQARVTRGKTFRRALFGGVAVYVSWKILDESVLQPGLSRILDELEKLDPIDDENDADYEDWFVPLPMFETVRQPPYSRSSPEWARYVEFNKESPEAKTEREKVANDVRQLVYQSAANTKWVSSRFGKVHPWSSSHFFLSTPPHPPPKILQLGWVPFPSDGGPWLRTRRTDYRSWRRTMRTFWPVHTLHASVAFLQTLFLDTITEGRSALGYPPSTRQESAPVRIPVLPRLSTFRPRPQEGDEDQQDAGVSKGPGGGGTPLPPNLRPKHGSGSDPTPRATRASAGGTLPEAGAAGLGGKQQEDQAQRSQEQGQNPDADGARKSQLPLFKRVTSPTEMVDKQMRDRAWTSFVQELTPRWQLPPNLPPNGCVEISGFVYLKTDNCHLQVDVTAHYDLVKKKLDEQSMRLYIRRVGAIRALRR